MRKVRRDTAWLSLTWIVGRGDSHTSLIVDEQQKTIRSCSLTAGNNRPDHHWESNGICYPPVPMQGFETWKEPDICDIPAVLPAAA